MGVPPFSELETPIDELKMIAVIVRGVPPVIAGWWGKNPLKNGGFEGEHPVLMVG